MGIVHNDFVNNSTNDILPLTPIKSTDQFDPDNLKNSIKPINDWNVVINGQLHILGSYIPHKTSSGRLQKGTGCVLRHINLQIRTIPRRSACRIQTGSCDLAQNLISGCYCTII